METSKPEEITETEKEESSTPSGFGQSVNNYLNHYITVADAKGVAILTGAFAILAAIIEFDLTRNIFPLAILAAFLFNGLTIFFCLWTLYPRLGSSGKGLILWDSIRSYPNPKDYCRKVCSLNTELMEEEYAIQNWHVSGVLKEKNSKIRISLWLFGLSTLCIAGLYLIKNII